MSSVNSVSGSGGLWQSLKSVFDDTSSKVKSDLKSGQTEARAVVQNKVNEIKDSGVSSLRHLIDTWV